MGCIIIELATLIVHGWESKKVTRFRNCRRDNAIKGRPMLAEQHAPDDSFHNNWSVVQDWIRDLKNEDDSYKLRLTLNLAQQMLNQTPDSRLYAWEAELDLYDIQHPDDDRVTKLEKGALCVQPPPQKKILNGTQTPLHRSAQKEDVQRFLKLLETKWPPSVQDHKGLTALDVFNQTQDDHLRYALSTRLAQKPSKKATDENRGLELLQAAAAGQVDVVQRLLAQEVDVMIVDEGGRSALYEAVAYNQPVVVECLLRDKEKGKELLRRKEFRWGDTPLHKAASMGHAAVMEQLLTCSPDIEDQQNQGRTALCVAAQWGHEEAAQVLLDHGAQVLTQNEGKGTPLHIAARHNSVEVLGRLLKADDAGKCLEHKNQWGDTPLWLALHHSNRGCAQILIQKGASLHVANNDRMNLLHVAVENGLYDFLKENLHQFNRDEIESRNRWSDTPLTIAQRGNKHDFVRILSQYLGQA